jgi:hypothetical protein
MATSFTFVTSSAANTAAISSSKVRVVANNACYYAINTLASATANVGAMVAQNRPVDINMQGVGNFLSVAPAAGLVTAITVTQIGAVGSSTLPKYDATGNVVMRTA